MLTCTEAFKTAIKADIRECRVKVVLNYSTPLTLTEEKIQSVSITNTADIALGGVENNDIRLTLMENALTEEQFNQDVDVEVFLGCMVGEDAEYISLGTFATDGWGKIDKSGIVTVNLTSKINANAIIPKNIIAPAGTTLTDYASTFIKSVFNKDLTVDSNVTGQVLNKSWFYYANVIDQLKAFGEACNGLFRYTDSFKLTPYKPTSASDTLKQGANEAILEVTRVSDYSKDTANVQILKSEFTVSDVQKLTSSTVKTPVIAEGTSPEMINIDLNTNCPTDVAYVVIGNEYGTLWKVIPKVVSCTIQFYDPYGTGGHSVPISVFGRKVESILKDKKETTDGSITYIENPYIQTDTHMDNLDKKIYEGIRYKVKYRGNPIYQVGDTLNVEGIGNLLIYSHNLECNGGLTGYLEGVLINE